MAILRNRTQNNFTMINNRIFKDSELSGRDIGIMCKLCSLPDNWNFSIAGLANTLADGKDAIRTSLNHLESKGYIKRITTHNSKGMFETIIELTPEGNGNITGDSSESTVSAKPTWSDQCGSTDTEIPTEYKTEKVISKVKTTTNVIPLPHIDSVVVQEAKKMFEGITNDEAEVEMIIRTANFDIERCRQVIQMLKSQRSKIDNPTGWILAALRKNYKQGAPFQPSSAQSFQKTKYDFASLNKWVQEN